MANIKPVSDLRSYNQVLKDIEVGEPVFLTKNGRGKYVILDINEYKKNNAKLQLLAKLLEAEKAIQSENDWISEEKLLEEFSN